MTSDVAVQDATTRQSGRLPVVLRAMSSRNYRLFFIGQLISLIGIWIGQLAMSWLIYEITGSKAMLGLVAFAGQIPAFILSPWAGVMVDRWKLRRTLIVSQSLSMLQVLTLAALTLAGTIQPLYIILLAIVQGLINAFDLPARQAFVVKMVDRREDLSNAIALNSMMFNTSRLIGPAAAGALIAVIGTGYCLLVNGLSYIAVILSLIAINVKESPAQLTDRRVWTEFREGLSYVVGSMPIRSLLIQIGVVSLLATPYAVLLPVFAKDIYASGPGVLGGLTSSIGCGALLGGLALASRKSVLGLGKWIAIGAFIQGLGLIGFSFSGIPFLGMICLAFCGFAQVAQLASGNTVLQTIIDDDKRGRVMAFYAMAFMGMMPLGSLLAGSLASTWLAAPGTVALTGIGCMLVGGRFAMHLPRFRQAVRPIYQRCGVLPAIAEGLKSADLQAADKSIAG